MYKKIIIAVIVFIFLVTSAFGLWTVHCEDFMNTRINAEVAIPSKMGFTVMYDKVIAGLNPPVGFKYYLTKIKKVDVNMKYGYYKVTNTPLKDFLDNVILGKQSTIKITFPEGYNTYDIANRMSRFIVDDENEFMTLIHDRQFILELTGKNLPSLEGYLYPNTYTFEPFTKPKTVIKTMYWLFRTQLPQNAEELAAAQGLTLNEAIILASIVQKETYDPSEAPIIASVYYNRLRSNMRLQADPTVIYGLLPDFNGNLTKRELQNRNNPYNTYRMKGLPPTAICNPSKVAIEAVLNPAHTNYLFFVADKNHKHVFSENYNDQINNVNMFQK